MYPIAIQFQIDNVSVFNKLERDFQISNWIKYGLNKRKSNTDKYWYGNTFIVHIKVYNTQCHIQVHINTIFM